MDFARNNSNALLGAGIGLLSGQGLAGGFGGFQQGAAMDRKLQEEQLLKQQQVAEKKQAMQNMNVTAQVISKKLGMPYEQALAAIQTDSGKQFISEALKPETDQQRLFSLLPEDMRPTAAQVKLGLAPDAGQLLSADQSERKFAWEQSQPQSPLGKVQSDVNMGYVPPEIAKTYMQKQAEGSGGVNIDLGGSSFEKKLGEQYATNYMEVQNEAKNAYNMISNLETLGASLSDPDVYQGFGAENIQNLKRMGNAIGLNLDGVDNADVATSIVNQLALRIRNPDSGMGLPGATSDRDIKFLKDGIANLQKQPDANKKIIQLGIMAENQKIRMAKAMNDYLQTNGTIDPGFDKIRNQIGQQYISELKSFLSGVIIPKNTQELESMTLEQQEALLRKLEEQAASQ